MAVKAQGEEEKEMLEGRVLKASLGCLEMPNYLVGTRG